MLSRTWSGGAWVNSSRATYTWESYLGLEEGEESAPQTWFQLGEPVPNPFLGSVHFTLEVNTPGHVTVTVHSIRGDLLCTVEDSSVPAGTHLFSWHADAPPGAYILRARGMGESAARKVVVIR